jgi:hypothetical protein
MSQAVVVDFAAKEPSPPAALGRMRLVSRCLEIMFLVLAVGFALAGAAVIFDFIVPYAPDLIAACPSGGLLAIGPHVWPAHCVGVGAMPTVQRLAHAPPGLLLAAPMVLLFWNLRRLFGLYAEGVVFAPDNARRLKHVGAALIVLGIAPVLNHAFLASLHLAIDRTWIQGSNIQELILGAVVWVIAQVMQLGRELEEERSQFV